MIIKSINSETPFIIDFHITDSIFSQQYNDKNINNLDVH